MRVLETAGAPVYYVPPTDVRRDLLLPLDRTTMCEWKGEARYWTIRVPGDRDRVGAAWSYPSPSQGFEAIRDHLLTLRGGPSPLR